MPEKLILHYRDPGASPADPQWLEQQLRAIGFLGERYNQAGDNQFLTGPDFLQYISFIGCSPTIYTTLNEAGRPGFCHMEISTVSQQTRFLGANNIRYFYCPHCRHKAKEPTFRHMQDLDGPDNLWKCPDCGNDIPVYELDLREQGGFGRFYIAIWGIGEGLAIPSDKLLAELERITEKSWRFFYCRTHE